MEITEIKHDDYHVSYDPETQTVILTGVIRLHGNDYNDIVKLLHDLVTQQLDAIILDTSQLEFLNSSGINHLLKFAVKLRNQSPSTQLIIKGSSQISWQQKSLKTVRALNKNGKLEWD